MSILNIITQSFQVFRMNRRRTFLTMLGVVIGISAVIIVMSVGKGAESLITSQITSFGSNLIGVLPGYADDEGPPASVFGVTVTTLKHKDALALKREIPDIEAITSYVRGVATAQYQNQKIEAMFVGTTEEYPQVESAQAIFGSFFDEAQTRSVSRVVVLGHTVWSELFGDEDPIGQRIKIKRESFRVIGVMEERGTEGFQNQDELVFIPLPTAQKLLLGINHVSMIRGRVYDGADIPPVIEHMRAVLRDQHGLKDSQQDDFSARAAVTALDVLGEVTGAVSAFLAAIAAISLLVGGIGIMNIMLVSVNERTREIGLRKALGATSKTIERQFLTESIILTIAGGIIGIALGALVSWLIAFIAQYFDYDWLFSVSPFSILLGFGVSGVVGIVFGWYPARKAAKLEPVEALRYE